MVTRSFSGTKQTGEILRQIVRETQAVTALLISREGVCISSAGQTESLNATALAALVAGMFAATKEVAIIVGEEHFSILLQQGEKRNIHISLIGQRSMLVVVFEDNQRIGRVRLATRQAARKLVESVEKPREKKDSRGGEDISMPDFREYALNLVDQIFNVGKEDDAPPGPR
jgi:predicted regulator of Ras-like GTPase activity (Roadblock/LC7/MglB family)